MLLFNTILLVSLALVLVWIIYAYILKQRSAREDILKETEEKINVLRQEWLGALSNITGIVNGMISNVSQRLDGMTQQVGDRLDNATKIVGEVQKDLGRLEESNKQIFEVGKNISTLQELLKAPKLRGGFGEFLLGDLLEQIMPKTYFDLQHEFKNGQIVDAAIKLGDRLVPVDAKFPLESFKRYIEEVDETNKKTLKKEFVKTLKTHIDDIASKYILPDEGTYEFALMYIPAENVYYEAIIKDETFPEEKGIFQYTLSKKVIPVSPNTFYAYLLVITFGLKGMHIQERVGQILQNLIALQEDFSKFKDDFQLVGKHLRDSETKFDTADRRLERFQYKLEKIDIPKDTPKAVGKHQNT